MWGDIIQMRTSTSTNSLTHTYPSMERDSVQSSASESSDLFLSLLKSTSKSWNKYKDTVLYLYPRCCTELAQYELHFQNTFGGPKRVIQYDRRIRTRVADSSPVRLSDLHEFTNEYPLFILASTHVGTSGNRGRTDRAAPHHTGPAQREQARAAALGSTV
jgi:hypothetical protein